MKIKDLSNYQQKLTKKLAKTHKSLPLKNEKLLELLADDGDFTYLVINDGVNFEKVKAYNSQGEILIERGQGDTQPQTFPQGSCVKFTLTTEYITDLVCSMPDCKPKPLPDDEDCGCC